MDQRCTEPTRADRSLPSGYLHHTLRPLAPGDERALSDFYAALSPTSRHYFEPYSDTSVGAMTGVVNRAVAGVDLSLVVLDASGQVFAHIFYQNVAVEIPHLGIGLLDEYHGLGVGAHLMGYLISLGRCCLGKRAIGLTVVKENERALRLYAKCGFRVVREVTFRAEHDSFEMILDFPSAEARG